MTTQFGLVILTGMRSIPALLYSRCLTPALTLAASVLTQLGNRESRIDDKVVTCPDSISASLDNGRAGLR
jgi:hypothetical protein